MKAWAWKLLGGVVILAVTMAAGLAAASGSESGGEARDNSGAAEEAPGEGGSAEEAPDNGGGQTIWSTGDEDEVLTYQEAGCEDEVRAAARERWPERDRDGDGTDEEAALSEEISRLEPQARKRWPDTFAGLWGGDTQRGTVVSIAFTEGAEEKVAELGEGFLCPELLRPVTFDRSMRELTAKQNRMRADRERVREGSLSLEGVSGPEYALDMDVRRNAVMVILERPTHEAKADFKRRYGDEVLVRQGPLAVPQCTRADCRYKLRAGLSTNLFSSSSLGSCTTGFTVRVEPGVRNILSAGHCGGADVGTARYHGGEFYGRVRDQWVGGRVDAERHGRQNPFAMEPWIFVNANNKAVRVKSRGTWSGLNLSTKLCKSGKISGKTCGELVSKTHSPNINNGQDFLVIWNACGEPGDSGAPVYNMNNWNRAQGIIHGGPDWGCRASPSWSIAGHIEFALNRLNVTLILDP